MSKVNCYDCYVCMGTQEYCNSNDRHITECSECGKIYFPEKYANRLFVSDGPGDTILQLSRSLLKELEKEPELIELITIFSLEKLFDKITSFLKRSLSWKTDIMFYSMVEYMQKIKTS